MSDESSTYPSLKLAYIEQCASDAVSAYQEQLGLTLTEEQANEFVKAFMSKAVIVLPEETADYSGARGVIVIDGNWSLDRNESHKVTNIVLDMPKAIAVTLGGGLGIITSIPTLWIQPFVVMSIILGFKELAKARVTVREAAIVTVMSSMTEAGSVITTNNLLTNVNEEFARAGHNAIKESDLQESLKTLEEISCVEHVKSADGQWVLIERVMIKD